MELLAERDPEEARTILDPVLERMMHAVHRYEGTVNQVMGDGIMALFGAPLAHEDHAVRACYAALAMQASVKQYAAEVQRSKGVPIQMRVGLNAGEVVVRAIGSDLRMDYTAVGQTTHPAARIEQTALPGTILLAPDTLRLAEGYVRVRALAPIPIKGLAALGQSEQSHWATPGVDWEERLRAGSPLQVVIRPQNLASAYVLLASRGNARAMTGVMIHVDAGSSLRMPRRS
jgi:class 3 adenylate cyclase